MVLFRADQRRAAQKLPLPLITREQISNGDLKNLLEESDYDLTTMVIQYSIPVTLSISYSDPKIPSKKPLSSISQAKPLLSMSIFTHG